jgi:hypothetical protein
MFALLVLVLIGLAKKELPTGWASDRPFAFLVPCLLDGIVLLHP